MVRLRGPRWPLAPIRGTKTLHGRRRRSWLCAQDAYCYLTPHTRVAIVGRPPLARQRICAGGSLLPTPARKISRTLSDGGRRADDERLLPGPGQKSSDDSGPLLRALPPTWRPYARLARVDKPAGTFLLMYPCLWSIALAAPLGSLPDPSLMALFGTGAFIMRSAGCTINDLWDQDYDRAVKRTKGRPIASGEVTTRQALFFLGGQLTAGLGVLLSLNPECIKLGLAVMPLVVAYPLMKRVTFWPQAVLGLAFNWGALMGWTAVHGDLSLPHALPLYGAGVCWTLVYDTLYGHQDKEDDLKLGLKSTAILFGSRTKTALAGFATAQIGLLALAGHAAGLSWPFYGGTGLAAAHLARQLYAADLDDPELLFRLFKSNTQLGVLVLASIVAGHF